MLNAIATTGAPLAKSSGLQYVMDLESTYLQLQYVKRRSAQGWWWWLTGAAKLQDEE